MYGDFTTGCVTWSHDTLKEIYEQLKTGCRFKLDVNSQVMSYGGMNSDKKFVYRWYSCPNNEKYFYHVTHNNRKILMKHIQDILQSQ